MTETAELGFCEEVESWNLLSRYLPSKVGGKPAWLDLASLPTPDDIKCNKCETSMTFLIQLYAPVDDDDLMPVKESCYHRALFVFCCRKCSSSFTAFRSQLPQKNNFYPLEDPEDVENWRSDVVIENFTKICNYCGCGSSSICSSCKKVSYCGKEHQVVDWKYHKTICKTGKEGAGTSSKTSANGFLFPEYKIVIEDEKLERKEKALNGELEKLRVMEKEGKAGTFAGDSSVDAELNAIETQEDKYFMKFKEVIKSNPEQVIRYNKEKPLWVSDRNIPKETDIPDCQYCCGKRIFEFQVMPQLLNYLEIDPLKDPLDWGTLAVYTCSNNCDEGPNYKQEFVWKQDLDK